MNHDHLRPQGRKRRRSREERREHPISNKEYPTPKCLQSHPMDIGNSLLAIGYWKIVTE
jgi:hypothetical protein